jgi:phospholipid/cholesterol/gamma-HCH transport system substrate-binding protein
MPAPEEVAWAKVRVAAMIGCAFGVLSVVVYLLMGGADAFRPSATVHAYMTDLSGLELKSAVQFNGIVVGEVTGTALSGLRDPARVVRVDMAIRNRFLDAIPEDSTVEVSALNVLDDKFVNINEGKSTRHLMPGGQLRQTPPATINPADLIKGGREILAQIDAVVRDMETGRGNIGKFVKGDELYTSLLDKVATFQRAIHSAGDRNSVTGRLIFDETYYETLQAPVKRLDQALSDLQAGRGAAGRLLKDPAQYDRFRKSVGDLNRALADLNAGKGSTGKLLKDDELYQRLNRVVQSMSTQLDAFSSGEGVLGQLLANSSLYETLQASSKNLQDVLRQLQSDPKKFLRSRLF